MKTKEEEIKSLNGYMQHSVDVLKAFDELLIPLRLHKGKLIDKRFFVEHFTIKNEYRDYTKYNLYKPRYDWSKHSYEIYLCHSERLELNSRETAHVIETIENRKKIVENWIKDYQSKIDALQKFDEKGLVRDLKVLYKKYGKPSVWSKVLDSYDVKYPEDK